MNLKFEHLVAAGGVALLCAAYTGNGSAAPAALPEPNAGAAALATDWLELPVVPTRAGPRVCALSAAVRDTESAECKGRPVVSVGEYFLQMAQRCPGVVPVSATPVRVGSTGVHRVFVLGWRMQPGAAACPHQALVNDD